MDHIVKVYISGPALSLLLYENLRCLTDQEGFLLGQKYARKVIKITDHDETVETTVWEIHVNSIIPCSKMASFYKGSGYIMPNSIQSLLHDLYHDVVGWYTFKREPELKLRLREKIIHKNLSGIFSTDSMEHFVWCVNTVYNNREKHTSKQTFIRYVEATNRQIADFQEIPLHIINLSDSRNEYKSAGIPSERLNNLIREIKGTSPTADINSLITKLERNLQSKITKKVKEVSESEQELFQLEQDIYQLTHRRETVESDKDTDSNDDIIIDGNASTDAVVECSNTRMITRQQKQLSAIPICDQSSPANGVRLDRDRGDCSSPSASSTPVTTTKMSYSAKLKQ